MTHARSLEEGKSDPGRAGVKQTAEYIRRELLSTQGTFLLKVEIITLTLCSFRPYFP